MATVATKPVQSKTTARKPAVQSLALAIDHVVYAVKPIPAGEFGTKAFRLTKKGGDGAIYDLVRTHDGLVQCDCPAYECSHRNTPGLCKHGQALVAYGLMDAPVLAVSMLPPAPDRAVIIEHTDWERIRETSDDQACRYHLEVYVGDRLVATERSFSLPSIRSLGRLALGGADAEERLAPPVAEIEAPRRRFEPTAEERRWANETSPTRNEAYEVVLPAVRPIRGGSPAGNSPKRVRDGGGVAPSQRFTASSDGPGYDSFRGWGGHSA